MLHNAELYVSIVQLVPRESAVPDNDASAVMIHKNHAEMVKFEDVMDKDFRIVVSHLKVSVQSNLSVAVRTPPPDGKRSCIRV